MRLRKQKDRSSLDATSNGMSRKAWREYSRSHIEYVAPASSKSGGGEYSRRISSDSYTSIRKQKSRRKRLAVILCTILAVIVIGGGAAAFGYVSFLNNQFHSGIEDMDALRESLVTSTSDEDPFYVLLMGTDGRPGEDTYRSDSILLARVDVPQKQVVLVSIPRDTYTYIEGVGSAKINAAHAYGGAAGAVKAIEDFAGVEISHYAEINFEGFKDLVDALGGVEVDVPIEINDVDAGGSVAKGLQTLDGEHALIFCRSRATVIGDYQRQANQRIFLQALASKVLASDPATMMASINSIAKTVSTDMDSGEIYSIASNLRGMTHENIYTYTVPSTTGWVDDQSVVLPDEAAWQEMMSIIDSGGLPESQVWDIAGEIPDAYNSAAKLDGTVQGNSSSSSSGVNRGSYSITVRNGGGIEGSASEVADKIEDAGFTISDTGNAQQFVYDDTLIIYEDEADLPVVNDLIALLGTGTAVESAGRYSFEGDLMVVVGSDWGDLNGSSDY